jgi:predicted NBD/HSP70 family sugar kinase
VDATQDAVVVGLDVGGTATNATVLTAKGEFLVDGLMEVPSRVLDGPEAAIEALASAVAGALRRTGTDPGAVAAIGLDTPGPASADGVISSRGSTNFALPAWYGYDIRSALEERLAVPVVYNNDGNAAALYAHVSYYGSAAAERSSISAIVGTGLGGGVIQEGQVVKGAAGMAGELGHVHIPMDGLLAAGQATPECACGFSGDAESVASLTGITRNLLPYWLARNPDHELNSVPIREAAKLVRSYGERGDELALNIFEQQAKALGLLFTIAANFTDPDAYFVGGGVVQAEPHFRDWFVERVRHHTTLRAEQEGAVFSLVPDLDMAGARGAALAAMAR